jgi:hypothetical protein
VSFKLKVIINTILPICIIFSGCENNYEEDFPVDCGTIEVYYYENIAPIMESYCIDCHSGLFPPKGLLLDNYLSVREVKFDILDRTTRNIDDEGFMPPQSNTLSDVELANIQRFNDLKCIE